MLSFRISVSPLWAELCKLLFLAISWESVGAISIAISLTYAAASLAGLTLSRARSVAAFLDSCGSLRVLARAVGLHGGWLWEIPVWWGQVFLTWPL